ncbi:hypothetical protein [Xanthobacter sediminis]
MQAAGLSREVRDGGWTLLKWDPATGRTVWVMEQDGKTVVRTDMPVAATLEANAAARNAASDGWSGDWHRVASVPMNLLYDANLGLNEAMQQGDGRYLSRWLNDAANRGWRTREGRV